jgi:hypothetical protein
LPDQSLKTALVHDQEACSRFSLGGRELQQPTRCAVQETPKPFLGRDSRFLLVICFSVRFPSRHLYRSANVSALLFFPGRPDVLGVNRFNERIRGLFKSLTGDRIELRPFLCFYIHARTPCARKIHLSHGKVPPS